MGDRYLIDLADVCRSTGRPVDEFFAWEFRSRSTGGYDPGGPSHVMWHHTASQWEKQREAEYLAAGHIYAPVCNLHLPRDGSIGVIAGGATNTNGKGSDTWGGGVADNTMNRWAIGIEISNSGVGERYTDDQMETIRRLGPALSKAYGIPALHHRAHFEWAPTRKVDPAGPPSPYARLDDAYLRWNMDEFRADIHSALLVPEETDMIAIDPIRSSDTRKLPGAPIVGQHVFTLPDVIPASASGAMLTVTAVPQGRAGFVTMWRAGQPRPDTSVLNFDVGAVANTTLVRIQDRKVGVYTSVPTHLIVDVVGYV